MTISHLAAAGSTWLVLTSDEGSVDLAEQELHRAAMQSKVIADLAPGVLLVDAGQPFALLAAAWAAAAPIFVRHICPVQAVVPLWDSPGDPDELAEALAGPPSGGLAGQLEPAQPFSVQARLLAELPYKPFDVNQAVSQALIATTGADLDVRSPRQVVSIVCAELSPAVVDRLPQPLRPGPHAALYGLAGLSTPQQNLSDWAGGMRRFAREEGAGQPLRVQAVGSV